MSKLLMEPPEELRNKFFALSSREELASLLGISHNSLIWYLWRVPGAQRYTTFKIPKANGAKRTIVAPCGGLKVMQRRLHQVLASLYEPKTRVHGFVKGRSIVTNARRHVRKRWVLNVDLEDFFPSIHFGRVLRMFMAKPYERNEKVAVALAQLCCHDKALPQGAPTSPIVSNMVCARMDANLRALAEANHCTYTRYADDLTFSTNAKRFPSALAEVAVDGDEVVVSVGEALEKVLRNNYFNANASKLKLKGRDRRQEVTGIVVNEFPNLPRGYVRQVRAMIHAIQKFGIRNASAEWHAKYEKPKVRRITGTVSFRRVVAGKLELLRMVKGTGDPVYVRLLAAYRAAIGQPTKAQTPLAALREEFHRVQRLKASARGRAFEAFLNRFFDHFQLNANGSLVLAGEQIDGSFDFQGFTYLVEAKWHKEKMGQRELLVLRGKVEGKAQWARGLFVSISGFTDAGLKAFAKGKATNMICMDGEDVQTILDGALDLSEVLRRKARHAAERNDAFVPVSDLFSSP